MSSKEGLKKLITSKAYNVSPGKAADKLERRVMKKVTGSTKSLNKLPKPDGPVNARDVVREAFYEARDERIKKKVEGKRNIRNGSGSSHGF